MQTSDAAYSCQGRPYKSNQTSHEQPRVRPAFKTRLRPDSWQCLCKHACRIIHVAFECFSKHSGSGFSTSPTSAPKPARNQGIAADAKPQEPCFLTTNAKPQGPCILLEHGPTSQRTGNTLTFKKRQGAQIHRSPLTNI